MQEQRGSLQWILQLICVFLLTVMFVISFVGYVATKVVTDDIVNARFYSKALQKNDIYNRIYTELLADPALRDVTRHLLGNFRVKSQHADAAYGYTASTLRLVLPPEDIRRVVDGVISELIAYLSGTRHRFDARLDLSEILYDDRIGEHVVTAILAIESQFIAQSSVSGELLPRSIDIDALQVEIDKYLSAFAEGHLEALPSWISSVRTSQLPESERQQVVKALMTFVGGNASPEMQMQIETALADDNLPGAIIVASRTLAGMRAQDMVEKLRAELNDSRLSGMATLINRPTAEVMDVINRLRDLVLFLRRDFLPAFTLMMIASLIGMMTLQGLRLRRILRTAGGVLILAGGTVIFIWGYLAATIDVPYQAFFTETANGSLPPSLNHMLDDVVISLLADLRKAVFARAVLPVGLGVILVSLAGLHTVAEWVLRLLEPMQRHPRLAIGASVLIMILVPVTIDWMIEPEPKISAESLRCNGFTILCDKRLNEVVFAATHNSMSISNYGWMWPEHDGTLTDQLAAGVRAMLIDTYYGDTPEKIDTFLKTAPSSIRPVLETIISQADPALKGDGMFLCHNLCSLGGTPLVESLAEIRVFMDSHPREVIVLILQDDVRPEDTARAFEESGLIRYVYAHDPGEDWPTLGEMIEQGTRLVVFAENAGPPPAWHHHAWEYIQETPFKFGSIAELSCVPNRGTPDGSLFLLNHWITRRSPDRVDATIVNAYDYLLNRAEECQAQRGLIPNFIAVNFYSIGDLFVVVDTLNGVCQGC